MAKPNKNENIEIRENFMQICCGDEERAKGQFKKWECAVLDNYYVMV